MSLRHNEIMIFTKDIEFDYLKHYPLTIYRKLEQVYTVRGNKNQLLRAPITCLWCGIYLNEKFISMTLAAED